jgi:hypothetical protein
MYTIGEYGRAAAGWMDSVTAASDKNDADAEPRAGPEVDSGSDGDQREAA